jgi:TAG lipase / steryl ester hydrolase / phospholipase A2 / LPA acyltransferase
VINFKIIPDTVMTGAGPPVRSRAPHHSGSLSDVILHPSLWRWLLFAGQPVRLAIAANVFLGRSVRSLAYDILRRLKDLLGWLFGRMPIRRFSGFERRYFLLRRWHAAALAAGVANIGYLAVCQWREHTSGRSAQRRALQKELLTAPNYSAWFNAAAQLERLSGRNPTKQQELEDQLYDRRLLQVRLRHLRAVRERGDLVEMMFALRSDLIRNLGNMASSKLHETLLRVPEPIREYIDEVRTHLKIIASASSSSIDERLAFLRETRHAFGRTALVLSGGGSFGSFHLGVVQALLEAGLLPRVLSGSSAGAIVAALICTRTPEELSELFAELPNRLQGIDFYASNTASQIFKHLVLKGTLQDHRVLQERLQRLLGDVTFQEAHARSGRVLNVSVTAADTTEPPRLLNYLTAPSVLVWSAVACSSAFPFLFAPQTLLARDARGHVVPFSNQAAGEAQRRWRDGSLEEDLPMRGLSEMFNVNYFLVSQCNPYLLPIIAMKKAVPRTLGALAEQEFKHRCKQIMEVLPRSFGGSRVLKLLSQPWEGDVTMVLPASSISTLKAVVNLSREDLLRSLAEGQRAAWGKLSAIAANCDVEVTLDESLRQVTTSARKARARLHRRASSAALAALGGGVPVAVRGRMPSWLHLQALGLPTSDSHETLEATTPHATATGGGNGSDSGRAAATTAGIHASPFHNLPRSPSYRRLAHPRSQVDLTDTIMPEEEELKPEEIENILLGGGGGGGGGIGVGIGDGDGDGGFGSGLTDEGYDDDDEADALGISVFGLVNGTLGSDASTSIQEGVEEGGAVGGGQGGGGFKFGDRGRSRGSLAALRDARMRNMSLGCGDDVWRDLFTVVPATTSDALDYIAP